MGKYNDEIEAVFIYIQNLKTTYYSPDEFDSLYKQLYDATIPSVDIEDLCQKLSALSKINGIDDIKSEIASLHKYYSCDIGASKIDLGIQIVEHLSMSIKQLSIDNLFLATKDFINLAQKKQIEKNNYYGDVWYKRGRIGVCRDMGRKIIRFKNFNSMIIENQEDVLDNMIDLLNYCVFYMVLAKEEKNV